MSHPYFDMPRPVILGHRGAAGVAPENTLVSFARALEDGADVIESDVQSTLDGIPVLLHDERVERTTDGEGAVSDLDLASLQALDAGHRFTDPTSGRPTWRGRDVRVPTLREAMETFPDARFNLEIKAPAPALIARVVETVCDLGREDRTLLVAGDNGIQHALRRVLAETGARPALGASVSDILDVVRSAIEGKAPTTDSMALQVPREFAGRPLVTPELVAHCHAHDIQVHVWTIDETEEMQALLDIGVDGLVTDWPARMARLLGRTGD